MNNRGDTFVRTQRNVAIFRYWTFGRGDEHGGR